VEANVASAAPDRLTYLTFAPSVALWAAHSDGQFGREILAPDAGINAQTLSPDGQSVAGGDDGIITITSISTRTKRVVYQDPGGTAGHPKWAPDQSKLIFDKGLGSAKDIYTINVDGSALTKIIGWKGAQSDPDFSPDGTKIAFSSLTDSKGRSLAGGGSHLFVAGATGANPTQITSAGALLKEAYSPVWAPSSVGPTIAFSGFVDGTNGRQPDIFSVNSTGAGLQRLTTSPAYDYAPTWYPDNGATIAFSTNREQPELGATWDIYEMNANGSNQRAIVTASGYDSAENPSYRHPSDFLTFDDYLAAEFSPTLRFDTSEQWRPVNVNLFAQERNTNNVPIHQVCDGGTCAPLTSTTTLRSFPGSSAFIDVSGNGLLGESSYTSPYAACIGGGLRDCDTPPRSAAHYHTVSPSPSGYTYLDYWYFYRYNYFGSVPPIANQFNHEGDWEGVTIAPSLDNTETFDFATFSQHGYWYSYLRDNLSCDGGGVGTCGTEAERLGQRVDTYVANGTHANYPSSCHEQVYGDCWQQDGVLPERGHDGAYVWGSAQSVKFPSAIGWAVPSQGNWVDWPGRWGNPAEDEPPNGPGRAPHFQQPWSNDGRCPGGNSGCPIPRTVTGARASRVSARLLDRVPSECRAWFGSAVTALACNPSQLNAGLRHARLNKKGAFWLRVGRPGRERAAATAPGVAQFVGTPLRPGQRARIGGVTSDRLVVLVRARWRRQVVTAAFAPGRLSRHGSMQIRALLRRGRLSIVLTGSGTRGAQSRPIAMLTQERRRPRK
jgi:Tol biopolymer transport system component